MLINTKIELEKAKKKIVKYLTRKEYWTHDYLRYSIFKKKISYIIKLKNNYDLRKLFLYLVDDGVFIKRKNKVRSYLYKFPNPHRINIEKQFILVSFD